MRTLMISSLVALAFAGSAFAAGEQKTGAIELKDGSTVHIFKDGKMAMEDKSGHARVMKQGERMETKDGQIIMMKGNEIWRLYKGDGDSSLLRNPAQDH